MEPSELDHRLPRRQDLQCFPVAVPPPPPPFPIAGINVCALKQLPPVTQLRSPEVLKAPSAGGVLLGLPIDSRQGWEAALLPPPFAAAMVQPDLGFHWPRGADAFGCHHIDQPPQTAAGRLLGSAGSAWTPAGETLPPSAALQLSGRGAYQELPTPCSTSCFGGGGGGDGYGQLQQLAGSYGGKMLMPAAGPSSSSFSFGVQEMQALELLASATFGQALQQPTLGNVAFYGEGIIGCGTGHHLPFPPETPSTEELQIPSLSNVVREGKRASGDSRYKASTSSSPPASKKPRTAAPPLKVRKEKLGDRIAALQQLVAPFGKTDTASVLTEAVGYIKFLQDQVQTLSMPYLRSSAKSRMITAQGAAEDDDDQEESKQDLRSRGLCLVPLSYTSYFTGEIASAWSSSSRGNQRYC